MTLAGDVASQTLRQACSFGGQTGLLGLKTLVCKLAGVSLSMAGGLIAGKEGPFVHAGAPPLSAESSVRVHAGHMRHLADTLLEFLCMPVS